MEFDFPTFDRIPAASLDPVSFADVLRRAHPEALPTSAPSVPNVAMEDVPHGTTILAIRFQGGVVIAGDRRATEGYSIAHRSIEKVFPTDDSSAVAIAGAAGPAIEMVRIFQTELEHYEKIEGERLTLEGRANKLSQFIRTNLPMAMQGMVVVPLYVGFDDQKGYGRIFKYDVTGGRYEETDYFAQGSGGKDARDSLKKRFKRDMSRDEALQVAIEALIDAADEDLGTGGPDLLRGILPSVKTITRSGFAEAPEEEIRRYCEAILTDRNRL